MNVRLAEIAHQALVRFEVDFLAAKENNAMRNNGVVHFFDLAIGKRSLQIDIADLGANIRRARRDGDGVIVAYLAHGVISWRDLSWRDLFWRDLFWRDLFRHA